MLTPCKNLLVLLLWRNAPVFKLKARAHKIVLDCCIADVLEWMNELVVLIYFIIFSRTVVNIVDYTRCPENSSLK